MLSSVHLAYLPGEIAGKCEQICRKKSFSFLSSEILLSLIFHVLSGPREPVCKNALYSLFHVLLHKIGEASEEITRISHTGEVEVLIEVFIKTGAQLDYNWKMVKKKVSHNTYGPCGLLRQRGSSISPTAGDEDSANKRTKPNIPNQSY